MNLKQFRKQPVLLVNHMVLMPDGKPGRIGDVIEIDTTDKGLPIKAKVWDDYEWADVYWPFIAKRRISGLSIGFRPLSYEWRDERNNGETVAYRQITKAELLEVSVVMIQANREAMIKQAVNGAGLSQGDAGQAREWIQRITERQESACRRLDDLASRLDELDEIMVHLFCANVGIFCA